MKRAIILVLDSLGLGSSDDSHLYGDEGSDTFGHIIEECALGKANSSCLLYTSPSPRDVEESRMPSSA